MKTTESDDYTLFWGTSPEVDVIYRKSKLQKVNHFRQSKQLIGNKAEFAKILQTHPLFPHLPAFFPRSFILPGDHDALYKRMKANPQASFISKPPRGSCGNGIKIITFKDFYSIQPGSVVSDYISRPLLIDGFKFDLRVYVLVTSFCPLRAFVYKDGLARFATEFYSKGTSCVYASLTNATLNKKCKKYCSEFKWKLSELVSEVEKRWGRDPRQTMRDIQTIIARTLTLLQATMSTNDVQDQGAFELFGFDILMDRDFKMWLLEVNTMPSLGTSEETDFEVKAPLVAQALSIAGIPDLTLADLRAAENKLSSIDHDELTKDLIKTEDERNRLSGDGFVRIFPSELSRPLERYLIKPPAISRQLSSIGDDGFGDTESAAAVGESLTGAQGMVLLIHVLTRIEDSLRGTPDPRLVLRLQCFLAAQGYRPTRGTANTRALLRHFIDRVNQWVSLSKEEFIVPAESRKRILGSDENVISDVLGHCDMKLVKNVRLLFP